MLAHFIVTRLIEGQEVQGKESYLVEIARQSHGDSTGFQIVSAGGEIAIEQGSADILSKSGYTAAEVKAIKKDLRRLIDRYEKERPRVRDPNTLLSLITSYRHLRPKKALADPHCNQFIILDHQVWYIDLEKGITECRGVDEQNLSSSQSPWIMLGNARRFDTSLDSALHTLGLQKTDEKGITGPNGKLAYSVEATANADRIDPLTLLAL